MSDFSSSKITLFNKLCGCREGSEVPKLAIAIFFP